MTIGTARRDGVARTSAVAAAAMLAALAVLQAAHALGAPLGALAWGGRHEGELPAGLRVGSAAAVVVLALAALTLLARGGVIRRPMAGWWIAPGAWAIAGHLSLNTLANLASSSPNERMVVGSTAVMAALSVVVARSGADPRMEDDGFEPTTSCLQSRRSPS